MDSQINQPLSKFNNQSPGYAVFIIKNNQVIFEKYSGLADLITQKPINSKTNFRLASLTKPFTAMTIMILKQKELLNFSDTINKFFPDYPEYGKSISVKQLLNHTSGLPDHEQPLYQQLKNNSEPTVYDSLEVLKQIKKPLFKPGSKYQYSDSGYVMLALIIEKITQQKYARVLSQTIFKPLNLTSTLVVDETKPSIPNRVFGYQRKNNRWLEYDYDPLNYIYGDEAIYSNIDDLLKWIKAWTTHQLINQPILNQALIVDQKTKKCGFSWFIKKINSQKILYHDGFWVGFNNLMMIIPKTKTTIIYLSNNSQYSTDRKRWLLAKQLLSMI